VAGSNVVGSRRGRLGTGRDRFLIVTAGRQVVAHRAENRSSAIKATKESRATAGTAAGHLVAFLLRQQPDK
jgi:hypothetical protein